MATQLELFSRQDQRPDDHGHEAAPAPNPSARTPDELTDSDVPGCLALISSIIMRAIHDACGVFTSSIQTTSAKLATAREAWLWLHSDDDSQNGMARSALVDAVGMDTGQFDRHIEMANIPWPTEETLKNPTLNLERTYWNLSGRVGPEPVRGLYQGAARKVRPTTRTARAADANSFILRMRASNLRSRPAQAATA